MVVRKPLLLDACIAINLLATGRIEDIAKVLDLRFLMALQAAKECGEVRGFEHDQVVHARGAGPEELHFADVVTLDAPEVDVYVELARDIDDGEAATLAIARFRSLHVATDDRKARRVAKELGLDMPIGTTVILRDYAAGAGLTASEIALALRSVRDLANYVPRQSDEHYTWWQSSIS
ncbi:MULTISPECIES: hypothetical protein [Saccharothrix]|uniref:hypothetical protein n=1 Tax=Saccharothrix TaxID=2071 RepID=UPI00093A7288|nr:hypothetical protein [Saccharothrix sp. CB00851]OKI17391.1 hypothetical protein A6A25_41015 [Saccharothrix sp. CB00851]